MKPAGAVARKGDYTFVTIDSDVVDEFCKQHYAKGGAGAATVLCLGMLSRSSCLVGVCAWKPPPPPAARFVAKFFKEPNRWADVLALSRLTLVDGLPQNSASMLIGASFRVLKTTRRWFALVTYADHSQGHVGTIYRATNWIEAGATGERTAWKDREGRLVSQHADGWRSAQEMEQLGFLPSHKYTKPCFVRRVA